MNEKNVWTLLARKLSGEASEEDIRELEKLVMRNPAQTYELEVVLNFWNNARLIMNEAEEKTTKRKSQETGSK
ncbi:MAG: hypothetical protein ACTHMM_03685 [Agriterribacter sp.]